MQELPCQHFGCHTQLGLWPWPRSSARCRSSSGSAAGGCGGCPCAVVPAHCSFSAPSGGKARAACSGTQGSTGFWPTRETPHPSLPVAENLRTAFPLRKIAEAEDRQDFPTSELVWFSSFPWPLSPWTKRTCPTQLCHDPLLCDLWHE